MSALFEHASADATFLLALVTRAVVEVLNAVAKECEVAFAANHDSSEKGLLKAYMRVPLKAYLVK